MNLKILFIGGTKFVGRQMVSDALDKGWSVSILQRGLTNPKVFSQVNKFIGDRNNIETLLPKSEEYDLVVDTCGYHPVIVNKSAKALNSRTKKYVFISTVSVYKDFSKPGLNENSEVTKLLKVPSVKEARTPETYGGLKVLCENEVLEAFGEQRSLILRPTIIVGPYDDTRRFDHWISKIMSSESILIPNEPKTPIQFIDVKALSGFALSGFEKPLSGIFNIVGPWRPVSFFEFLETAKNLLNPRMKIDLVDPHNIDEATRHQQFPMFYKPEYFGAFQASAKKAYDAGLEKIEVTSTILETAKYLNSKPINI